MAVSILTSCLWSLEHIITGRILQLFPLLLMELLGDYHGLPGLYVAAVFAAALSSVSSAVNSLAAVVLEDFIKPIYSLRNEKKQLDEAVATKLSKGLCE